MTKYFFFLLFSLFLCGFATNSEASSCEKNGTCKKRFQFQGDPIDIERESSRSHIAAFYTLNFATNRLLESPLAEHYVGKLSKNERIVYTTVVLFTAGFLKELCYDPDGVSTSDVVSNSLGIMLAIPIEFSFF